MRDISLHPFSRFLEDEGVDDDETTAGVPPVGSGWVGLGSHPASARSPLLVVVD